MPKVEQGEFRELAVEVPGLQTVVILKPGDVEEGSSAVDVAQAFAEEIRKDREPIEKPRKRRK